MQFLLAISSAGLGYLFGSIPSGFLLCKMVYKKDVRTLGSGNIGATNVMRNFGKIPGIAVFSLDGLKALLPVVVTHYLVPQFVYIVGIATVLGSAYSIFLKFNSGKGVAASLFVMLAIHPILALIALLIWIAIFTVFRYVSLASISSVVFLIPFAAFTSAYQHSSGPIILSVSILAIIIIRHTSNIQRLMDGNEKKI